MEQELGIDEFLLVYAYLHVYNVPKVIEFSPPVHQLILCDDYDFSQ